MFYTEFFWKKIGQNSFKIDSIRLLKTTQKAIGANKNKRMSNKTYINVVISIIWQFNNFLKFSYFKEDPPKLTRRNDNEQTNNIYRYCCH